MNRIIRLGALALLSSVGLSLGAQNTPASQMEKLDRGVVVVPAKAANCNFISWRLFGTDDANTTFQVLRDGTESVAENIANKTHLIDTKGNSSSTYQVVTFQNGVAVDTSEAVSSWGKIYKVLQLDRPATGAKGGTYSPNDISVGDADGDGQYELFLKWDPSNSQDNSKDGYTDNVFIDCYKLDGRKLWRVDLGVNIRAGAHYTQFLVWDFDGDGKAEMICKTASGSKDGEGNYVSKAADNEDIKSVDNSKDWRNSKGKVTGGQEYLTVFNGETGKAEHTIFYNPNRATGYGGAPSWTFNWDDRSGKTDKEYGNRGERYLATVAYLQGPDKNPSAVMVRGYYTFSFLWAVDFDGSKLTQRWLHASKWKDKYELTDIEGKTSSFTAAKATRGAGSNTAYGNGNHNLSCADVDGDSCDEILFGAAGIDHDGKLLYATGYGHGDAMHVGDLNPQNPGLEVFTVHESSPYGCDIHDAATGKILFSSNGSGDTGRGMAADIDANHDGAEFWDSSYRNPRNAITGKETSGKGPSTNFRLYWNGDLFDDLFDGRYSSSGCSPTISTYNSASKSLSNLIVLTQENSASCNTTKATPCLSADILGDWREEVILWNNNDPSKIQIFTTNETSNVRIPTLMHDHTYRLGISWQNSAYNQPPHLGYSLAESFKTRFVLMDKGEWEQSVMVNDSITRFSITCKNAGAPTLLKSIYPDGSSLSGKVMDGFTLTGNNEALSLEGAPSQAGKYRFVFVSGENIADKKKTFDTLSIYSIDTFMVRYLVDDILFDSVPTLYRDSIIPIAEPTKEGHVFGGWLNIPMLMPANDITIKGYFKMVSLEEIIDKKGTFEVYNLQGICIGKELDAQQIKSLQPGIYLINRKKVLIK